MKPNLKSGVGATGCGRGCTYKINDSSIVVTTPIAQLIYITMGDKFVVLLWIFSMVYVFGSILVPLNKFVFYRTDLTLSLSRYISPLLNFTFVLSCIAEKSFDRVGYWSTDSYLYKL